MKVCLVVSLLPVGCMTERIQPSPEYRSVQNQSTFLVQKIDFDEHGRPLFRERISMRPGSAGQLFTIVHTINNRPSRSYDIAVVEQQKADMSKPLAVVYEWTGRGFEGGLVIADSIYFNNHSGDARELAALLAIKAAPVVIGGVAGFVVGLVSSVPETASELKRVIVNTRETVIGYTTYEYDERNRIRFMKLYPPAEHADWLVKTEFHYAGDGVVPEKAEVTSLIEQKVRTVH